MRLGACALVVVALSPVAWGQGRLVFDAERHVFGPIAEGDTAMHDFGFTNAGDAPLRLVEVQASCGCTTPRYTSGPVAPGERGVLTVAYDSRGRPGPFEKTVFVTAAGAEPADALLRIVGTVVPAFVPTGVRRGDLVFASDTWDAGAIPPEDPIQHAFRFQHTGERPIRILGLEAPDGVAAVAPERPLFPGDVYAVLVTIDRPADLADASGRLDIEVVLTSDDPSHPEISLRLAGRIEDTGTP